MLHFSIHVVSLKTRNPNLRKDRHAQLLVDHKGKDSHLGGTALVELDGTLLELGILVEGVPAKVDGVVTEVTNEFSSGDVLHDGKLQETDETDDLGNTSTTNGIDGGESVGDGLKSVARVVNGTRKTDAGLGNEVSNNGEHGNTSVLDFDVTQAVESGLVAVGNEAKGIPETKRNQGTDLVFEGHLGGDRSTGSVLGRSKGGGTSEEGGEDNELHGVDIFGVN
jgi:hypothetical protein